MSDFVAQHFPQVRAHHMMVVLDACSSGMAIPGMATLGEQERRPDQLTLAQIRAAVDQPARDLLVAGTAKQKAIAEAGGLLTKALLRGLRGEADFFKTGLVKFDAISFFVRDKVIGEASSYGLQQTPSSFRADTFGTGEFVFQLPLQR
jgi:hypothetical protein